MRNRCKLKVIDIYKMSFPKNGDFFIEAKITKLVKSFRGKHIYIGGHHWKIAIDESKKRNCYISISLINSNTFRRYLRRHGVDLKNNKTLDESIIIAKTKVL